MSHACLPETFVHTLGNGLEIIVIPEHSAPVVSVQAWVKVGSVHEGRHLGAGISHLLEHLVFKGTRRFGAAEAAKVVQEAGGYLNAYTSFERTVYWIDAPAEGLETALDVLTELVFHPRLPEEEFEREKEVIRREISMGKDDPRRHISEELFASAFRVHPCREPVIGHLGAFNRLVLEDVREYHAAHYIANNVFLVVCGDVEVDEVVREVERRTGDQERRGRAPVVLPVEPRLTGRRRREIAFATDVGRLQMAWHVPGHIHPDIPALDLLGRALGSGESGRLYRRLREGSGIAHDCGAGLYSPGFGGLFFAGGETNAERMDAFEDGLRREMETVLAEGITEAELGKARCGARADFLRGLESTNGLAGQVGASWLFTHSTDYPGRYLEGLMEVGVEKVRAVAENYLAPDRTVTVRMLPEGFQRAERGASRKTKAADSSDMECLELPNGLRMILGRDARLPLVSIHTYFEGGASSDPMDKAGLSSWLANGLWKGTDKSTAAELAERIEARGGSFASAAGVNCVNLSVEMLAADFDLALETMAEVVHGADFPLEAMERERVAMIAAAREVVLQPLPSAGLEARRILFAGTGLQNSPSGSEESLRGLVVDALPEIWERVRSPERTVLGVFGDFDPVHARAKVEELFGGPGSGRKCPSPPPGQWPGSPGRGRVDIVRPKEQAVLLVVYPTEGLHAADSTALDLIDEACGDMGSRFFQRIREEQGLAYYVAPFQIKGKKLGGMGFYLGTSADKLDHAENELLDEIRQLRDRGLDEAELGRARQSWRGKFLLQNQSVDARGRMAVLNSLLGLGADHAARQLEEARLMPSAKVAEAAARVFSQEPVIVRVVPGVGGSSGDC